MRLLLKVDPPELAGGRYAAPAWLILAAGALVAALALGFVILRLRRPGKDKR